MEEKTLIVFDDPDDSFTAKVVKYPKGDVYHLEYGGDEVHSELDMMDNQALKLWAEEYCSENDLEFKDIFQFENGEVNYKRIKEEFELVGSTSPKWTFPSGRAYERMEEYWTDLPMDIDIDLCEGDFPGSDWAGVIVYDYESLVKLQQFFLQEKSLKVVFDIVIEE